MSFILKIGNWVINRLAVIRDITTIACSVVYLSLRPSTWRRPVRNQLARQILFTGIEAVWLVVMIAVLAGISVVVQAQLWLARFGHTNLLGAILVTVIIRELGPLLVNFVVIGRSGTAICTELANMKVRREDEVLDAQGIDPIVFLVVPRVLGMLVSVFSLTVIFIFVSLLSGYLFAFLLGLSANDPSMFVLSVLRSLTPNDIVNILAKTMIPSVVTGSIACLEAMSIRGVVTEVPQATTRAVVRSIMALLLISVIISVFTYV